MLTVLQFPSGDLQANTWLVYDNSSKDALIFDLGGQNNELENAIKQHNLQVKGIYITHGHFDHIYGIGTFLQKFPSIPVYCPENELDQWQLNKQFSSLFGVSAPLDFFEGELNPIKEGQSFPLGNTTFISILTPGHTKGSMCFYNEKAKIIITGDTLFGQGVGRTDFPGGSSKELKNSIKILQEKIDKDTMVYSGHGEPQVFSKAIKYAKMLVSDEL